MNENSNLEEQSAKVFGWVGTVLLGVFLTAVWPFVCFLIVDVIEFVMKKLFSPLSSNAQDVFLTIILILYALSTPVVVVGIPRMLNQRFRSRQAAKRLLIGMGILWGPIIFRIMSTSGLRLT